MLKTERVPRKIRGINIFPLPTLTDDCSSSKKKKKEKR